MNSSFLISPSIFHAYCMAQVLYLINVALIHVFVVKFALPSISSRREFCLFSVPHGRRRYTGWGRLRCWWGSPQVGSNSCALHSPAAAAVVVVVVVAMATVVLVVVVAVVVMKEGEMVEEEEFTMHMPWPK